MRLTDGRTAFSSLDRVCIPCHAVKIPDTLPLQIPPCIRGHVATTCIIVRGWTHLNLSDVTSRRR